MISALEIDHLRERFFDPRGVGHGYPDLHQHVLTLAERGRLILVDRPIDKDSEMHPLVRWQFRGGLPEPKRCAFLFTQPTDAKGRAYDGSVLIGGLAANREIYSIGMGVPIDKIGETWVRALANPLAPRGRGSRKFRCRSRRPDGIARRSSLPAISSRAIRIAASRISVIIAGRSRRRTASA